MKKKKTTRNTTKYAELKPSLNLKGRQDYMDTDYVNGVKDKNGNVVIRALTDVEKTFLAQFYKEWLNADPRDAKLYTTESEWKAIFDGNNARNRCLLNHSKKMGNLVSFDVNKGDKKFIREFGKYDLELMTLEHSDMHSHESDEKLDLIVKAVVKKLKKKPKVS